LSCLGRHRRSMSAPIPTRRSSELWLSAGYFPAMQLGNQQAGDALLKDTALVFGGALLTPALISGGVGVYGWGAMQGQFWVGVATHAGSRAAYQVGAYGYMQVHATQQAAVSGLYSLQ